MAKPKRAEVIPPRCARCGNEQIRREELSMHGKLGFMGPDYRFDVSIFARTAASRSSSSRVRSG